MSSYTIDFCTYTYLKITFCNFLGLSQLQTVVVIFFFVLCMGDNQNMSKTLVIFSNNVQHHILVYLTYTVDNNYKSNND